MSASMAEGIAEVLKEHQKIRVFGWRCRCGVLLDGDPAVESLTAHQAEQLAANGYGKLDPTRFVLAEREAELLNLKGRCSKADCRLHFAHRGPCDTRRPE